MLEINKETLEDLYLKQKLSTREIAKEIGITKGQVEVLLENYNIPRRTVSEALLVKSEKIQEEKRQEAIKTMSEKTKSYNVTSKFTPIVRRNFTMPIPVGTGTNECTVTVVLSDMHLGDANHLHNSYWSTISNIVSVLNNIKGFYKIKELFLILNGDIVSGRGVFKSQELRNLVQRGHWQVFLAEMVLKDTISQISSAKAVDKIVFNKGTHETLDDNFMLYIKRLLGKETLYLSHGGIFNIGGKLGQYYVLFTHGFGYNEAFPVSSSMLRDSIKTINSLKGSGIQVDRICSSHSHWISSGFVYGDIYIDTTGGFQKWEYTLSQRPCGGIVYLYNDNEVVCIPVRPDPFIEKEEKENVGLEYNNFLYYGKLLLKHLKEVEGI